MSTTTTIPAVIGYLVDIFTDDTELGGAGVEVVEGENTNPSTREWVTVGDVTSEQEWAALGAKSRNEHYSLQAGVAVTRPGDERADARARVFELLARVETLLRATPTPAGTGVVHLEFGGVEKYLSPFPQGDDEGFTAGATFAIRVTARI